MNCEKCEPLLLDELYEELDEVTSAAVQRHVAGCTSCAASLEGLRSTRSAVSLPLEPLPAGLEDRILASAAEATKVVSIQSRTSRAVAWAGRWAMRPQTAMAAVFLLMIGTSAFVLRSRAPGAPQEGVSVTVQGSPAPAASVASAAEESNLDDKAAHGAVVPAAPPAAAMPVATATASAVAAPEALALNSKDERAKKAATLDDDALGGIGAGRSGGPSNAGVPGGAPASPAAGKADPAPRDGFSSAMADYNARRFQQATQKFEGEAQTGDKNAALWAARSSREGSGCAAAVARFDRVAAQSKGTAVGRNATLEAARCYRVLGNYAAARQRLAELEGTDLALAAKDEKTKVDTVARATDEPSTRGSAPAAAAAAAPAAPRKAAAPAAPRRAEAAPKPAPSPTTKPANAVDQAGF